MIRSALGERPLPGDKARTLGDLGPLHRTEGTATSNLGGYFWVVARGVVAEPFEYGTNGDWEGERGPPRCHCLPRNPSSS